MVNAPSKPPQFTPKTERLPERKRMTIAIGILANDGIVLAADREEGDGYLKTEQGKITWKARMTQPMGTCAVTGAGDGPYIDEIASELEDVFTDDEDGSEQTAIPKLRNAHRAYYKRTVVPCSSLPALERPDYSLLIACYGQAMKSVWITSRMAFTKVQDYEAVGVGSNVAKAWLSRLWDRIPTYYAAKLAAYVIYQVSRTVGGCGLGTDILLIPRIGIAQYISDGLVREWENVFRAYAMLERNTFYYCIGLETKEELLVRTKPGKDPLVEALDEFRQALTRLDSKKPNWPNS